MGQVDKFAAQLEHEHRWAQGRKTTSTSLSKQTVQKTSRPWDEKVEDMPIPEEWSSPLIAPFCVISNSFGTFLFLWLWLTDPMDPSPSTTSIRGLTPQYNVPLTMDYIGEPATVMIPTKSSVLCAEYPKTQQGERIVVTDDGDTKDSQTRPKLSQKAVTIISNCPTTRHCCRSGKRNILHVELKKKP